MRGPDHTALAAIVRRGLDDAEAGRGAVAAVVAGTDGHVHGCFLTAIDGLPLGAHATIAAVLRDLAGKIEAGTRASPPEIGHG